MPGNHLGGRGEGESHLTSCQQDITDESLLNVWKKKEEKKKVCRNSAVACRHVLHDVCTENMQPHMKDAAPSLPRLSPSMHLYVYKLLIICTLIHT